MKSFTLIAVLSLTALVGCNAPRPVKATSGHEKAASEQKAPTSQLNTAVNRFENVSSKGTFGVALDTVTGQWCRTWNWTAAKGTSESDLNNLPTCLSLYAPNGKSGYIFVPGQGWVKPYSFVPGKGLVKP